MCLMQRAVHAPRYPESPSLPIPQIEAGSKRSMRTIRFDARSSRRHMLLQQRTLQRSETAKDPQSRNRK